MTDRKYTLIGHGEAYREEFKRPGRPMRPPAFPRAFDEASDLLRPELDRVTAAVARMSATQRIQEVVLEVRLNSTFLAKSYLPKNLMAEADLTLRGSTSWQQEKPSGPSEPARALFVSGRDESLQRLRKVLEGNSANQKTKDDVRKIESLRLVPREEKLRFSSEENDGPLVPTEIVLFDWDLPLREQAIARVREVIIKNGGSPKKILERTYTNGPTFIGALVPERALIQLGDLNFVRAARAMPRVRSTGGTPEALACAPPPPPSGEPPPSAWLAIFDGGVNLPHPHLDGYVIAEDLTTKPAEQGLVAHGTAVTGAALYGSINQSPLGSPKCRVLAFRVLPDNLDDRLELYGVIDALEAKVPTLPANVRVVSLSLGPEGPIDSLPSRFTYAVDRLSYETGKLFCTAVGNWGDRTDGLDRVQAPADAINNLGIGAYSVDAQGTPYPAPYSCRGPGRPGGQVKPDLTSFGGCATTPFVVLHPQPGHVVSKAGTSYATPVVAALAAQILSRTTTKISTEAARAILIHTAKTSKPVESVGFGHTTDSAEMALECTPTRVSILYEGKLTPRQGFKLPFLLPQSFSAGGTVSLKWTLTYSPETQPLTEDEYSLAGVDLQFRPHCERFTFSKNGRSRIVNVAENADVASALLDEGWTRSRVPATDSGLTKHERDLRIIDKKWETVIHRTVRKRQQSIKSPCLTASIIGRGVWDKSKWECQAFCVSGRS